MRGGDPSTAMEERKNYYVGSIRSRSINNSYRFSASLMAQTVNSNADAEEFEEEDIWGLDSRDHRFKSQSQDTQNGSKVFNKKPRENGGVSGATTPRRLPAASRMIPRSALQEEAMNIVPTFRPQSAPISIPDWSQIYSRRGGGRRNSLIEEEDEEEDDEEEGEEDGIVPPHELVARQMARSQMTPFSMCEGAGRTLKGRDLSRVRNAILTRTGFLE